MPSTGSASKPMLAVIAADFWEDLRAIDINALARSVKHRPPYPHDSKGTANYQGVIPHDEPQCTNSYTATIRFPHGMVAFQIRWSHEPEFSYKTYYSLPL